LRKGNPPAKRAVATRYEKQEANYRVTVVTAALVIRLSYRTAERALALELQRTPAGESVD
jgi:hypothetical protein